MLHLLRKDGPVLAVRLNSACPTWRTEHGPSPQATHLTASTCREHPRISTASFCGVPAGSCLRRPHLGAADRLQSNVLPRRSARRPRWQPRSQAPSRHALPAAPRTNRSRCTPPGDIEVGVVVGVVMDVVVGVIMGEGDNGEWMLLPGEHMRARAAASPSPALGTPAVGTPATQGGAPWPKQGSRAVAFRQPQQ